MSEQQASAEDTSSPQDEPAVELDVFHKEMLLHNTPDHFLQRLVGMVNRFGPESGGSIPITLYVGGLIVCGHIASGADYFDFFASALTTSLGLDEVEVGERFRASIAEHGDIYRRPAEEIGDDATFIHLREAYVMDAAGHRVPVDGAWWRGRLSHVSGFVLGVLAPVKEN